MPTPEQITQAITLSIAKWEKNASIQDLDEAILSANDCPLCQLFFFQDDVCCGCPIAETTNQRRCNGTPYNNAVTAEENCDLETFITYAEEEVLFLKSLHAVRMEEASS